MTCLYFAFGSNMSPRQMARRCPGVRPLGAARLAGWRFLMTTRGTANIRPAPGREVHGVVWRCRPHHLAMLDRYEGVRWRNYRRRLVTVIAADGRRLAAITYVSLRHYPGIGRTDYLTSAVLPGARAFCLPQCYQDELAGWLSRRPIGLGARVYLGRRQIKPRTQLRPASRRRSWR